MVQVDKNDIISKLIEIIKNGDGDIGRNQYLLKQINKNSPIFESDKKYLMKILKSEFDRLCRNHHFLTIL